MLGSPGRVNLQILSRCSHNRQLHIHPSRQMQELLDTLLLYDKTEVDYVEVSIAFASLVTRVPVLSGTPYMGLYRRLCVTDNRFCGGQKHLILHPAQGLCGELETGRSLEDFP